jgi:hypothetical protein
MNRDEYKAFIRAALKKHVMPAENRKILEARNHDFQRYPYTGHCADATLVAYILFGRADGLKAFKAGGSGHGSHYWLAHPDKGHELDYCDLTEDNPSFDYTRRKKSNWISHYACAEDLKAKKSQAGRRRWKLYQLVIEEMKGKPCPSAPDNISI